MMHIERGEDARQVFTKNELGNAVREHAALLHPRGGWGLVTVAHIDPTEEEYENRWRQKGYRVKDLHSSVGEYAGCENVWISLNRFRGGRKVANLLQLCAVYSDCDFYKIPELADKDPAFAAEYALQQLRLAGIPDPSLIVSFGQGLQLVWFLEPVPAQALPRWTAIQYRIHEVLEPVGADACSKDAARVFRLAGTVHGKSGNVVEIIGGDRAIWNFDALAAEVLPFSRDYVAELRGLRVQRAKKRSKAPTNPSKGQRGNLEGYDLRTLAERRMGDLQTLRYERYPSGKMDDHRDRWLLLMSVEMSHITYPAVLEDEIRKLSREIGYPEHTALSNMTQVVERAYSDFRTKMLLTTQAS